MSRTTKFKGEDLTLMGNVLKVGDTVPQFTVTGNDMADLSSKSLAGKTMIISAIPSIDTPVCAIETKRFNDEVSKMANPPVVLTVSMDLPFAQKRWCGSEGVTAVITASDYKHRNFGEAFGVHIKEWGLLSRAVFVVDKSGKIVHAQYVPEVSSEPDYESVMDAVRASQ